MGQAPGTSLIDPDVAPFLAYNEEYFRDITAADVARLVPAGPAEPTDDPDYRVPALGRYYALEWEDEDAREAARQAEAARRAAEEEERRRNPAGLEEEAQEKKRPRDDDAQTVVQPVAPLEKPEELPDNATCVGTASRTPTTRFCTARVRRRRAPGVLRRAARPQGRLVRRVCEGARA